MKMKKRFATMNCPKCNKKMVLKEGEGHIGLTCNLCEGIWLSGRYFSSLKYENDFNPDNFMISLQSSNPKETNLMCPGCGNNLNYSVINNIELDWCGSCEGVWFDKSELGALVTKYKEASKGDVMVSGVGDLFFIIGMLIGN